MKKTKKIIALLLTLVLAVTAFTACGGSSESEDTKKESSNKEVYRTLDEIKEDGTIKIGVFSDKNPFGYVDEDGNYQG